MTARLWFKADMRDLVLAGKKTCTTRLHRLNVGEVYDAVCGSRLNAKPFAKVKILTAWEASWPTITSERFREEGFASPQAMTEWCIKNGLTYHKTWSLFCHDFEVVSAWRPVMTLARKN